MPTNPAQPFQRIPDYQILVDASDNASTLLEMDKTPGASLREFIESLDLNADQILLADDLPDGMTKEGFSDILEEAITGVTLTVDGANAAAGAVVDRTLPLTLTLDAVREVEVLPASGSGAALLVDRTEANTGKKLRITFPVVPEETSNVAIRTIVTLTSVAVQNDIFTKLTPWTVTAGDATLWDTTGFRPEAGKDYLLNFLIQAKGTDDGNTNNYDVTLGVIDDGDTGKLGLKTAFFMDRRENYDYLTVVSFGFSVPILSADAVKLYEFYLHIDPGLATVTGKVWIEEITI